MIEENNISSKAEGLDDELKILKEKGKKLEAITEQLETILKKEEIQKREESQKIEESSNLQEKIDTSTHESNDEIKFDQDRLALSKQEIVDFCDNILTKWADDPTKNAKHIFAMNAVKTSVLWTDEDTLKEIWGEILSWAFDLLYKNAIAQAKDENLSWSHIMDKLSKK